MRYQEIVEMLGWAGGQEQAVRITTRSATEIVGVPTSLDTHVTAHEVYLRPVGDDGTDIAIPLEEIDRVELV